MSVKLEKDHKINLAKPDGGQLSSITIGLGWDAAGELFVEASRVMLVDNKMVPLKEKPGKVDLDASCIMLDGSLNRVDSVYLFGRLTSSDGSMRLTATNPTGDGNGDYKQVIVDLTRVPASVQYLVLTVNSLPYTFDIVKNAFVCVLDDNGVELCKYDLAAKGPHTAMVMSKIYRYNGGWKFHAIGEHADGQTFATIMDKVRTSC